MRASRGPRRANISTGRRDQSPVGSLARTFWGSLLLTLTNPPTIVMFAAVFAALAPRAGLGATGAVEPVAGVFVGSLVWWCAVVAVVTAARRAIGASSSVMPWKIGLHSPFQKRRIVGHPAVT